MGVLGLGSNVESDRLFHMIDVVVNRNTHLYSPSWGIRNIIRKLIHTKTNKVYNIYRDLVLLFQSCLINLITGSRLPRRPMQILHLVREIDADSHNLHKIFWIAYIFSTDEDQERYSEHFEEVFNKPHSTFPRSPLGATSEDARTIAKRHSSINPTA